MIDTQIGIRGRWVSWIGRSAAALTALLGMISCKKANPDWCPGHPHDDCRLDAGTASGEGDPDGGAGGPDGGPSGGRCTHAQCVESNACLPDGTCAAAADVAYVQPGATGSACTKQDPCDTLGKAIAATRPYVKVSGRVTEFGNPVFVARDVIVLADAGAEIAAGRAGDLLDVGNGKVDIYDLGFTNVKTTERGDAAIFVEGEEARLTLARVTIHDNMAEGVTMGSGSTHATVTIVDSTITRNYDGIFSEGSTQGGHKTITVLVCLIEGNGAGVVNDSMDVTLRLARNRVTGNRDGGFAITDGKFEIVGNVITNNGMMNGMVGGVRIEAPDALTNRLEFNTIYGNRVSDGTGSGIHCNPSSFTARNNILFQNTISLNTDQIGGSCHHSYSFLPQDSSGVDGDHNIIGPMSPMFVDPENGDFHLAPGSPALEMGDPNFTESDLSRFDRDGHERQRPPDIGAYQAP